MKIQVQVKNVYGKETIYPICPIALNFARLVGQKTLTRDNIKIIKDMGYEIEAVHPVTTF